MIRAHSNAGDYEIYKYGLDLDKLAGMADGDPSGNGHFKITQSITDPMKDYYNTIVDTEEEGGNPDSHYLADDQNKGKTAANGKEYESDAIEKRYHYGSVSEDRQVYNDVAYPSDKGDIYRDGVQAMEGMQTAYDGLYASMLVPWTVTEPADELAGMVPEASGESSYQGFAYRKYRNTFYTGKLRIEKLDSETGENILHDGAVFAIYAADREDNQDTDGLVKFYERETLVKGSKEFLEAMGAVQITPAARAVPDTGSLWTGYVPAGTPICSEAEQVILTDQEGRRTGQFEAFVTTRDGKQADEGDLTQTSDQDQNVGYIVTPQPLGAGTYVLCEVKPPAGYARTKPVAIEIYSDKVSYYLDGNKDSRVTAAVYEEEIGKGPQGLTDTARIYVGNTPIRVEVSKVKDKNQTVTYQTATRLEGDLTALKARYGDENLEYAYKNGNYLGYAWYKGTLEYLESRKAAGEAVEPVYINGIFAGYGLVTRTLDTADDQNRYTAGAKMTLYDAIEVKRNGDSGDYGYDGLEITRDKNSNVQSMKVLKGYAGTTVEFINRDNTEGSLAGETGEGTWTYQTVERGDTDILYYSLADLKVTETGTDGKIYGYDRDGHKVLVRNRDSIYALKNGRPLFEITGGDLEKIKYSALDKYFSAVNPETVIYHLDEDRNRDSLVNPDTGMAYVIEKSTGADGKERDKVLVWPVNVAKTAAGAVIARDKIRTYRIAAIHADTDQEYTIGTYDGNSLKKTMNPVINGHGLPEYYQRSDETYTKGSPLYDIDGDYIRYQYDDLLPAFNDAAYRINNRAGMEEIGAEEDVNDDGKLYHRQGEAWIMENTWITGEAYPNDPFKRDMTVGQADMLKRVIPGTYIMEELEAPSGYVKGLPAGLTVGEMAAVQNTEMVDEKIKVEIVKTDAADQYKLAVESDYQEGLTVTEPKGAYSYGQIAGARLVLYKARRVYSTDSEAYPEGYYLEKAEDTPAEWTVENTVDNAPMKVVADWITDGSPKYFEGIPAGDYILEELEAASGYIRQSMALEVKATGKVQTINMKNDHTKLEVYKYYRDADGSMAALPNDHAAGLALYEAKTDSNGNIIMVDGQPQYDEGKLVEEWTTDDLTDYTQTYTGRARTLTDRFKSALGMGERSSNFLTAFEEGYREKGSGFVYLTWNTRDGEHFADRISFSQTAQGEGSVQLWKTDSGKMIRITIYRDIQNGSLDETGNVPWKYEYQFNYRELTGGVKSYDTLEGMHRIDYLPFHAEKAGKKVGNYVLVETKVPDGYEKAAPKAITLTETGAVQRYSLENKEKYIDILKVITNGTEEYAAEGVKLALYRADDAGNFTDAEVNLVESWISGSDGRYTNQNKFDGKIPSGLAVGDLKAHRIDRIPYGIYYVAELEVPPYMAKAEPVKLKIGADTTNIFRVRNKPTEGKLEVIKTAEDTGKPLENARFLVANRDTGESWYITTGHDGRAELPGLPVGIVQTDGTIKPYTYAIEEISPPDLYQISGGKKFFQFDSADSGMVVTYTHRVEDKPTQIWFKKTNFDTGMAVGGAEIAVYHATAVDGEYKKDGVAIETVVSGPDGFVLTKKLAASQAYIMEELKAPAGMHQSAPVIFTVNRAGTGILNVANDFSILKLSGENGAIESLTVTGRVANKVFIVIKDLDTGKELPAITGSMNLTMTTADGIVDGHLYEITEYTRYSDGNVVKSRKETKRIHLDAEDGYTVQARTYTETRQELSGQDGNALEAWSVDSDSLSHTVRNPVTEEVPTAMVSGNAGRGHTAVKTGDVVKYTITYENPENVPMDITITASLAGGLEFMRATEPMAEINGIVTWRIQDAAPHSGGSVDLVAVVTGQPGEMARARFKTDAGTSMKETVLENPIAPEGSLTVRNHLAGTGKDSEDSFVYRISFKDRNGSTLTGYQGYSGSKDGRIKGDGTVTLMGDEYITFAGLPYGTKYEVEAETPDGYGQESRGSTGTIEKGMQSAVFVHTRHDGTQRAVLTAGGNYRLTETTAYSDGAERTSGIYRFSINESGNLDNVDMEDKPIKLYFSKVDIDTGEEISGGHYTIRDAGTGEVIYEYDKGGKPVDIPANLIVPGKEYIFREDLSPTGYAYEEEIRFTANEDGIPETVTMQDKKTRVYLEKIDKDTGEQLIGGRYSVKDPENGATVFSYTADGHKVLIEGILVAGKTYELVEEEPPAGYAYSRTVEFTVPKEAEDITVTMKDKKTEVLVEKLVETFKDASPSDASKQLPGFVMQVLQRDKTPAKAIRDFGIWKSGEELVFTTTDEFTRICGQLDAGAEYWLHEIKPRDGYAYAEDVPFTVSTGDGGDVVSMMDKPTHAVISKKAITGSDELPGNHMAVTDKTGKTIERWVSGEKPHEITGVLTAGETYYLCEESPKEGYAYAEKVSFTVSLDGRIDQVEMRNEVTKIRINKVNANGIHLKGAVLQVLDEMEGIVIPDFATTGVPVEVHGRLAAGKTYYLHEVTAPSGYLLSADIAFKVPELAELVEITMVDPKRPEQPGTESRQMYLRKTDAVTGEGLSGFEFTIYRPDGEMYKTVTTGYNGYAYLGMPADGTYTYRETHAEDGYMISAETYSFTVKNGRVTDNSIISVANHKTPEITVKKADGVSKAPLANATFRIWNGRGWSIEVTTASDGCITFSPPQAGVYQIQETAAPEGYVLDERTYILRLDSDGSTTGIKVIYNYPVIPENPDTPKKIGRVYASYSSLLTGRGTTSFGAPGTGIPGQKTGDETPITRYALILFVSMLGMLGVAGAYVRKKRKGKRKNE